MKIIIIGSVAAGTSVAAKARRNREDIEIVIYEKDSDISYSGCGLPYYLGEDYIEREDLTPRTPKWFKNRFNIDIKTQHEVLEVDTVHKQIKGCNLQTGTTFIDPFDRLVFATGATPIVPSIANINNHFTFMLRNVNHADLIDTYIKKEKPQKAIIVGAGYIGLELAENLKKRNIQVTIIDMSLLPAPNLDEDISIQVKNELDKNEVQFIGSETAQAIEEHQGKKHVVLNSGKKISTDMVIVCVGVRPETTLATKCGVKLGITGAIEVNQYMETNLKEIYAVGDCAQSFSSIDNSPMWVPLGSTANKMGRVCGDFITKGNFAFQGILGTGIFKVFDLAVATTGFTEKQLQKKNRNYVVHHNIKPNQSEYFNTSKEMMIKMLADKDTGKVLGAQIVGENGVDKRIDVIATAISFRATVHQLSHLDLAYAPPFSTTKDPVHYSGMVLRNAITERNKTLTPRELMEANENIMVIDVRASHQYNEGHIKNAINIPLADMRSKALTIDKNNKIVMYCNKGVSGNAAQNILQNLGFKEVYNLSGGYNNYVLTKSYLLSSK
ncbi:FAD-dependent oxidoreductase [Prolixibacteraceae bacterium]|nr:FAD-dependent oxidoreductase [Prolixibacteraceae bacterium]